MNRRCKWTLALCVLSLVLTGLVMRFLPARVPMHFNAVWQPDRMGSKYELLIFPLVTALSGALLAFLAHRAGRRGNSGAQLALERSGVALCAFLTVLFFALTCIIAANAKSVLNSADAPALGGKILSTVTCTMLGLLIIALSNLMPKAGRNAAFGLRTTWSMKNDRVWQRCQRFGGYSGVAAGVIVVLSGLFLDDIAATWAPLGVILLWSVLCVAASYTIWKDDQKRYPE